MKKKRITGNLPDMIAKAQGAGYTHVLTFGGPVPLREWKPYSHTIPPLEFEIVGSEFRERHPGGSWLGTWTVFGVWPLCRLPLKCIGCGKKIIRGQWTKRVGNRAAHGSCVLEPKAHEN